jgi:hypothetical protein
MEFRIAIRSDEFDDERLHASTLELRRSLLDETEASVAVPTTAAAEGAKGDPITIGAVALTFLTSGAAISMFKVLEAYVTRKRSIEVEISRPDGGKFVLRAQDVTPADLAATQRVFEKFVRK